MARVLVSSSSITGEVRAFAGTVAPDGYLLCQGQAVSRTTYPQLFATIGTSHGSGDGATTFNLPDYRGNFLRGRVNISTRTGSGTASSNNATFTSHGINRTGFRVRLSSGTLTGLALNTDYYAIVVNTNTLAFASSLANAIAGVKIAISGANTAIIKQWEDPDLTGRVSATVGANSSSNIGSLQFDAFKTHTHSVSYAGDFHGVDPGGSYWRGVQTVQSGAVGDDETRPKNMLVNFIIKY